MSVETIDTNVSSTTRRQTPFYKFVLFRLLFLVTSQLVFVVPSLVLSGVFGTMTPTVIASSFALVAWGLATAESFWMWYNGDLEIV